MRDHIHEFLGRVFEPERTSAVPQAISDGERAVGSCVFDPVSVDDVVVSAFGLELFPEEFDAEVEEAKRLLQLWDEAHERW